MIKILGSQITKIKGERKELDGPIKVSTELKKTSVEEREVIIGGEMKKGDFFDFAFKASYNTKPLIEIEGSLFFTGDAKEVKAIKSAKSSEAVDEMLPLLNQAYQLCSIQAILLSEKLRIPAPIKLPRLAKKE